MPCTDTYIYYTYVLLFNDFNLFFPAQLRYPELSFVLKFCPHCKCLLYLLGSKVYLTLLHRKTENNDIKFVELASTTTKLILYLTFSIRPFERHYRAYLIVRAALPFNHFIYNYTIDEISKIKRITTRNGNDR